MDLSFFFCSCSIIPVSAQILDEAVVALVQCSFFQDDVKNVRWLTPLHWIQQIVLDELEENKPQVALVNSFMGELKSYRNSIRRLFCYDWVCVPLVYTQVSFGY